MISSKLFAQVSAGSLVALALVACSSKGGDTSGGDAGGGDASVTDADGKMDAKTDAKGSGGGDTGGGDMCPTPADVTNFMPPAFVPPVPAQMVCSAAQVQGFYDNCLGMNATQMKCSAFTMSNKTCVDCLDTPDTDPQWGALIEKMGIAQLNVSGCVYLKGDQNCAKALQAADACDDAACGMQCPVMDQQSFMDYQKCLQTAEAKGCKKYVDAANAACGGDGNAAYQACTNFQSFDDGYFVLAPMFCGGGG